MNKIEYQIQTINKMIQLYCKKKHSNTELCVECKNLLHYANQRLTNCPFGIEKPECVNCPIHCYNVNMRQQMKTVMQFSGPRMIIYHPKDFIKHMINKRKAE